MRGILSQQFDETVACAGDTALDRADGNLTDVRRLLVRKSRRADEDQRFALIDRQLLQSAAQVAQMELGVVVGRNRDLRGTDAIGILDLELTVAQLRVV